MTIVKIIALLLGLAFTAFGYLIVFRGKYDLINGFTAEQKAGRRDERCAQRVGRTELVLGIVLLLCFLLLQLVT